MSDDNQQITPPEIATGQHSRQSTFEAQRERGGCLTIILLFFTIITFYSISSIFKALTHPASAYDRSIFPFINLILIAVDLISLYEIWKWRKWGVKLLVIGYIFYILLSIIVEITLHIYNSLFQSRFFILDVVSAIMILAVFIPIFTFFYLEVKKRWHYFS
jgi:hypothetical protein